MINRSEMNDFLANKLGERTERRQKWLGNPRVRDSIEKALDGVLRTAAEDHKFGEVPRFEYHVDLSAMAKDMWNRSGDNVKAKLAWDDILWGLVQVAASAGFSIVNRDGQVLLEYIWQPELVDAPEEDEEDLDDSLDGLDAAEDSGVIQLVPKPAEPAPEPPPEAAAEPKSEPKPKKTK